MFQLSDVLSCRMFELSDVRVNGGSSYRVFNLSNLIAHYQYLNRNIIFDVV